MRNGKITVVIVDDSVDTVEHTKTMISLCGQNIEVVGTAYGGRQGVMLCQKLKPDIVLMDINMPDMDGLTATGLITAAMPDIAVIMMSVQGEYEYQNKAKLAGAKEYLVKPFSLSDLASVITRTYETRSKFENIS